jgi:hypothetical protein
VSDKAPKARAAKRKTSFVITGINFQDELKNNNLLRFTDYSVVYIFYIYKIGWEVVDAR